MNIHSSVIFNSAVGAQQFELGFFGAKSWVNSKQLMVTEGAAANVTGKDRKEWWGALRSDKQRGKRREDGTTRNDTRWWQGKEEWSTGGWGGGKEEWAVLKGSGGMGKEEGDWGGMAYQLRGRRE